MKHLAELHRLLWGSLELDWLLSNSPIFSQRYSQANACSSSAGKRFSCVHIFFEKKNKKKDFYSSYLLWKRTKRDTRFVLCTIWRVYTGTEEVFYVHCKFGVTHVSSFEFLYPSVYMIFERAVAKKWHRLLTRSSKLLINHLMKLPRKRFIVDLLWIQNSNKFNRFLPSR